MMASHRMRRPSASVLMTSMGLAGEGMQNVSGFVGLAVGHILRAGEEGQDAPLEARASDGVHGS